MKILLSLMPEMITSMIQDIFVGLFVLILEALGNSLNGSVIIKKNLWKNEWLLIVLVGFVAKNFLVGQSVKASKMLVNYTAGSQLMEKTLKFKENCGMVRCMCLMNVLQLISIKWINESQAKIGSTVRLANATSIVAILNAIVRC